MKRAKSFSPAIQQLLLLLEAIKQQRLNAAGSYYRALPKNYAPADNDLLSPTTIITLSILILGIKDADLRACSYEKSEIVLSRHSTASLIA
ncbi:hypothetical protein DC082_06060 [Ignatzschineria indica]|uniref:Uncharacterized protein n=2 Tax=Ignatzschineria indica TaxID=472583 RepID=A0A2U2AJK8_9GAMM|nr:hypothetical protein DC082_06060 [Ignatzschineria indica]